MAKRRFHSENLGPQEMGRKIDAWFRGRFYETQRVEEDDRVLIQARKASFPRPFIAANRAFNVLLEGDRGDFTVEVTFGKWIENLTAVGILGWLTGLYGLAATGIMAGLSILTERELWDYIVEQASKGEE